MSPPEEEAARAPLSFDPPLSRWESWTVWLWFMFAGSALAGMVMGVFWWWGVLILTIPILLAAYWGPTLIIYFTPALLSWLALRRRPFVALLTISALWLVLGAGVPAVLNQFLERNLQAAVAGDAGGPVRLGTPGTLAWLEGRDAYCSSECLRFLITGRANAVLVGPELAGPPVAAQPYMRISRVPSAGNSCPPLPVDAEKHIWINHLRLIDSDHCLVFSSAPLGTASMVFNQGWKSRRDDNRQLPHWPLEWRRYEVFGWRAGQPVVLMRRTEASATPLATPLTIWPLNGADEFYRAKWGTDAERKAGQPLPIDPMTMVADKLYVPAFDDKS